MTEYTREEIEKGLASLWLGLRFFAVICKTRLLQNWKNWLVYSESLKSP
ncbi:MAG: hypothetical protein QXV70_04440 [Saccharolobus sp.]